MKIFTPERIFNHIFRGLFKSLSTFLTKASIIDVWQTHQYAADLHISEDKFDDVSLHIQIDIHCLRSVQIQSFFLVRIFLYSDQRNLCIWTLFTQWHASAVKKNKAYWNYYYYYHNEPHLKCFIGFLISPCHSELWKWNTCSGNKMNKIKIVLRKFQTKSKHWRLF